MFKELPKQIQQQILYYLQTNNFIAAKRLRDAFFNTQSIAAA